MKEMLMSHCELIYVISLEICMAVYCYNSASSMVPWPFYRGDETIYFFSQGHKSIFTFLGQGRGPLIEGGDLTVPQHCSLSGRWLWSSWEVAYDAISSSRAEVHQLRSMMDHQGLRILKWTWFQILDQHSGGIILSFVFTSLL